MATLESLDYKVLPEAPKPLRTKMSSSCSVHQTASLKTIVNMASSSSSDNLFLVNSMLLRYKNHFRRLCRNENEVVFQLSKEFGENQLYSGSYLDLNVEDTERRIDKETSKLEEKGLDTGRKNKKPLFTLVEGSQLVITLNIPLTSKIQQNDDPSNSIIKSKNQQQNAGLIYILLSAPSGKYPVEIYEHQRRLHDSTLYFLEEWIVSKKLCSYSTLSPSFLGLQTIPEIKHAFFVGAPLLLKSSKKFRIFLKFAVCQWIMDDFIVKSVSSGQIPFLSPVFFNDLRKILSNILSGQYRHVDAVPYFDVPIFHHCLKALFEVFLEIKENVGHEQYNKLHGCLLQEVVDWIDWHQISAFTFIGGQSRSYRVSVERLRFRRGRGAILEVIQLLQGTALEEVLRRLKIFTLFCDTSIMIHEMAIETLALENVKMTQSSFNGINDAIVDFQRIGGTLRQEYEENGRVLRFIRNVQCFVDGGIRALVEDWKCRELEGMVEILKLEESNLNNADS